MKNLFQYAKQNKYKKHVFGSEVIPYLQKCLNDGTSLAKYIGQHIDLKKGITETLVEENVTEGKLLEFNSGGKIPVPKELLDQYSNSNLAPKLDTSFWIAEEAEKHLSKSNACFINSDILARPTDDYMKKIKGKERILVFNDKEVYYLYCKKDLDQGKITPDFIGNTPWATILGIMTDLDDKEYKIGFQDITSQELIFFVKNLKKIIFNVYDGESYIIWSKN